MISPKLEYNEAGLIPCIVQEEGSNRVLMMAWLNEESLKLTLETGIMHYWSRSRGKLWRKGETSGHEQRVVRLEGDCDSDTLLATVHQTGVACHTGRKSCFFNQIFPELNA